MVEIKRDRDRKRESERKGSWRRDRVEKERSKGLLGKYMRKD